MRQPIRIAAYIASILQLIAVGIIMSQAYGARDMMMALLLAVPAVLTIAALYRGPDKEERLLQTQVTKARLRKELQDLEGKA